MAFDENWETIFSQQEWGKYPCEEVIRVTARNFYCVKDRKSIKILDLGCGGGATTWYLAREGFDVYGIDGSTSAIKQASNLLQREKLTATLMVSDFVQLNFDDNAFDAVYDLSAIQHNRMEDVQKIYQEIIRVLKPKGLFFSNCISDKTTGQEKAEEIEKKTFLNLNSINNDVLVHLFSEDDLRELMEPFDNVVIDAISRTTNNFQNRIGHYLVSGFKRD